MAEVSLEQQAARLECLLPKLMRRMFTLEAGHPAAELTLAQLRICSVLQGGPRAVSALGEELGISTSAVTQSADRLERLGLVERISGPEDRRVKHLQLTAQGAAMMRSRREARVRGAAAALERLPAEARAAVLRAVEVLLEAGQAAPPLVLDGEPALLPAGLTPDAADTPFEAARLTL